MAKPTPRMLKTVAEHFERQAAKRELREDRGGDYVEPKSPGSYAMREVAQHCRVEAAKLELEREAEQSKPY